MKKKKKMTWIEAGLLSDHVEGEGRDAAEEIFAEDDVKKEYIKNLEDTIKRWESFAKRNKIDYAPFPFKKSPSANTPPSPPRADKSGKTDVYEGD